LFGAALAVSLDGGVELSEAEGVCMASTRGSRWFVVIAGLATVGLATALFFRLRPPGKPNAKEEPERVFAGSSDLLKETVVLPTLDTPIPENKSAVWCISLQLAWNRLKEDVVKEPIKLSNSQTLADWLNQGGTSEMDVPADASFAMAGAVDDGIIEKIESGLAKKFPDHTVPPLAGVPGGYIAFGYVKTDVRYADQFFNNPEWLSFRQDDGHSVRVRSFGLPDLGTASKPSPVWGECRDQVRVLFREGRWFAVDLSHQSAPNQVLLAKLPRGDTLAAMLAKLNGKIAQSQPKALPISATLLVPNLNWRIEHDYRDLKDNTFLNARMQGRKLITVSQFVDFKMDRFGAAVESGAILGSDNGHEPDLDPDRYHFDQPFLIVLKKRDANNPFFVMWVDNAELLCKR
jgi:hypothetical protein